MTRKKTDSPVKQQKSKRSVESSAPAFTYAATANQYARDVISERIPACQWVRLACKRHLDNLAESKRPGYRFRFDEAKANRVCDFIEGLPHIKGDWAARGEEVKLQPWQCFVLCGLFGWVRCDTGFRRFTVAYIAVPRKNGKSFLAAGIGVYMFAADGEFGAEVFSGATSEKQAWEVFRPAKQMVDRTQDLKDAFGIHVGAKNMAIFSNGSRFEPVIGKPGDGSSPHCAIVDEYHEADSDSQFDTFRTGMGARKQPLLLAITTAGDNLAGPCKALQDDVGKVLNGSLVREEVFGLIYTVDASDDWTSETSLRKANPNYGISVFGEFLQTEQRNAIENARKQNVFKTKHLNIWVGANVAFINLQKWNELADPSLKPEEFRGLPCVAAADLSSKKDIAARVIVFKKVIDDKDHFMVFGRFYLPAVRAEMAEFQHYQAWAKNGSLLTTPGGMIDYDQFTRDTIADVTAFRIRELGFDPWNAEMYAQEVGKKTSAIPVEIPQQVRFLSDPMKQLDALIADGRIHHDGNPVLTWMMGNLSAHTDAKDNVFPRKERDENKIDGAVALIMALSRAIVMPNQPTLSIYATRGLLRL